MKFLFEQMACDMH